MLPNAHAKTKAVDPGATEASSPEQVAAAPATTKAVDPGATGASSPEQVAAAHATAEAVEPGATEASSPGQVAVDHSTAKAVEPGATADSTVPDTNASALPDAASIPWPDADDLSVVKDLEARIVGLATERTTEIIYGANNEDREHEVRVWVFEPPLLVALKRSTQG